MKDSGQQAQCTCSAIFVLVLFADSRYISSNNEQLWETATMSMTEDEHEINSDAKEVIILIADAIETTGVPVEMIGLTEDGSHLGKIDVAEIIENLIEEEEIVLVGDIMK